MRNFTKRIACLVLILCINQPLAAGPVNQDMQTMVDVRRTTLIVNDADKSLALYKDALGLNVIYDQMINSPMEDGKTKKRRLVLLQANDDYIGVIGILQYIYPLKPQRTDYFDEPVPGDPIIVMNVKDLETRWASVESSIDVEVIESPHLVKYPRADGGTISVMVSMIRDPDGYWIEVNKLLDEPAKLSD